jgi:sigma-B regulation protein RsbU (phosphoserine phosphatase)
MATEPVAPAPEAPPPGSVPEQVPAPVAAPQDPELVALRESLAALERRMQDELRLAASVQRALLPQPRDFDGLEFAREFLPFREIGGDYFDVIELPGRRVALAIGDVMGKGVAAALLVATLKSSVRSELRSAPVPLGELMGRINRLFFEVTPRGRFASLFLGVYCLDGGRLDYVNAGHDYPLTIREDGACEELVTGGTVIGLVDAGRYEDASITLERGDQLVLYTDGLIDRMNAQGEMYGAPRLQQAAARSRHDSPRIALYSLLGEVQGWSAGRCAEDDMTLLVAKRT